MNTHTYTLELVGKTMTAQFTDLTDQANGSVLLTYGETTILVTAVMGDRVSNMPYFPLSVEFEEKFYAAGQILGSRFMRREGRPSDEAVLTARIIDRTLRPLFDQRLRYDIQVVVNVLAMGDDDPDVLGVIGASLALSVSDIPWGGPVGAARIAMAADGSVRSINPTYTERLDSAVNAEVLACGKDGLINMIETGGNEASEDSIITALKASRTIHQQLETWQAEIIKKQGKAKREIEFPAVPSAVSDLYETEYRDRLYQTIFSDQPGKQHITALKAAFLKDVAERELQADTATVEHFIEEQIDTTLHDGACKNSKRADGRGFSDIRPLYAQAGGLSPVLHGSGIFYRGGTHIFSALTLGGPDEAQLIDTIELQDTKKRFLHHYNFPPFSVGETGRVGGFNRRMIGHGALAEKALTPVIPPQANFPYTIRLVSETLASNGSSSMGSVCASTLALMDGGVPITRPVAGIASGVLIQNDIYRILTDIQGPEDEHGDMDFKVAGTCEGITAMQMDVKVDGVSIAILSEALEAAKVARLEILEMMANEIAAPRENISPRAPEIVVMTINPEQIGLVIGGGGKTINSIKDRTAVDDISIEEDGTIYITGRNGSASAAQDIIAALTKTFAEGESTTAVITTLTDFGAFAKLSNEQEGLIHVSEIAPFRVEKAADVLTVGQTVPVIITKIERGKIGLSIVKADARACLKPTTNN